MSSRPFVLVQISDTHIGADWAFRDPTAGMAQAVACISELRPAPDAVLVSGDLTDHAAPEEYEQFRQLIEPLGAPLMVLPGNHDERASLRAHFDLPGAGDAPVRYGADLGAARLLVLDSTVPGAVEGRLDGEQLEWLDSELSRAASSPTVIALHHPPIMTGLPAADAIGMRPADVDALAAVLERHPQVRRLLSGHVHRVITGEVGGREVLVAPSTYVQMQFDLVSEEIALADEATGFVVHLIADGEVISHVRSL